MTGRIHGYAWRDEETKRGAGKVTRPMVDIRLTGVDTTTTKALIDTGSPRTIFPRGIGDLLCLPFPDLTSDASDKIKLMGRDWYVETHEVHLHLPPFDEAELAWTARVDFVLDEGLDFGILGYEGFLNRWAVSFNGYHAFFIVEPLEDFNRRQPRYVLEGLGLNPDTM